MCRHGSRKSALLAELNFSVRQTPRARDLVARAAHRSETYGQVSKLEPQATGWGKRLVHSDQNHYPERT
jgi:hypothetical protein